MTGAQMAITAGVLVTFVAVISIEFFVEPAIRRQRIESAFMMVLVSIAAIALLVTERNPAGLLGAVPLAFWNYYLWAPARECDSEAPEMPDELDHLNWGALFVAPAWAGVHVNWKLAALLVGFPAWASAFVALVPYPSGLFGISTRTAVAVAAVTTTLLPWSFFARAANAAAWPSIAPSYEEHAYARSQARWLRAGLAIDIGLLVLVSLLLTAL